MLAWCALLAAADPTFAGSDAERAAKAAGEQVAGELALDLDGDGASELAVALAKGGRCRLEIFSAKAREDGERPALERALSHDGRSCDRVLRLEAREIVPGRPRAKELLAVFESRAPDETLSHVRVVAAVAGRPKVVFEQSFFVTRDRPSADVELGDATPRLQIRDIDEPGEAPAEEIVWISGPQILELGAGEARARVVVGAERKVFRYDEAAGAFALDEEAGPDPFLAPRAPWEVRASAQVPKIWGTAQAFWGADDRLDTAWSIPAGKREWLELGFEKPERIQLVRLVPGLPTDEKTYRATGQPRRVRLEAGALGFEVDLADLGRLPKAIRAAGEFPNPDGVGRQVLLLLAEPVVAQSVRLVVLASAGRGETALSELALY